MVENIKSSMTTQCKPGGGTTIQIIYRKEELFKTSSFKTSERRSKLVGDLIE